MRLLQPHSVSHAQNGGRARHAPPASTVSLRVRSTPRPLRAQSFFSRRALRALR
jgi:hypothetical protein